MHVNTVDVGGGAERIASTLAAGCRQAGHEAWLSVGRKRSSDPDVLLTPDDRKGIWSRAMFALSACYKPVARRIGPLRPSRRWFDEVAFPFNYLSDVRGGEDFHYPQTGRLLDLPPESPDILHLHNLHGGYFDLRRLTDFTRGLPCVITLHDQWLLTGHCAYAGSCQRWLTGCGACPDLSIYPGIRRDATAENWRAKAAIYRESKVFVAAPSRWLLDQAERSMLAAGLVEGRVIPNGIDTSLFRPRERNSARRDLNLPEDRYILLAAANLIRSNRFKDWPTLRKAVNIVAERAPDMPILFIALGEDAAEECVGAVEIRFVPFETNATRIAPILPGS